MVCANGRIHPTSGTKLRLFSDSAGYCQRPDCRLRLFSDEDGPDYHIGEIAHVIAAAESGPRANSQLSKMERAAYANLILLCPNCHTEIDKAPEIFLADEIFEWKATHKKTVGDALGVAEFESRDMAREFIVPLLRANKRVFKKFGPDNNYRQEPEAEEAMVWRRKMLSQIIPNNQTILLALDKNSSLLNEAETETVEEFRQHVDDLTERHLGENRTVASRFPNQLSNILTN